MNLKEVLHVGGLLLLLEFIKSINLFDSDGREPDRLGDGLEAQIVGGTLPKPDERHILTAGRCVVNDHGQQFDTSRFSARLTCDDRANCSEFLIDIIERHFKSARVPLVGDVVDMAVMRTVQPIELTGLIGFDLIGPIKLHHSTEAGEAADSVRPGLELDL